MLTDILRPISTEDFFLHYWTKRFLHLPGSPEKFEHLFPWDVLNHALEEHRFPPERLGLVRASETLEPSLYLANGQVDADRLMQELADGATLVFNYCEDVHRPLRELCLHLERLFHVRVHVNLYAGWRKDNGFDVHWDDQDTLILQVSGRKHWKVWLPTRTHPFKQDLVDTSVHTRPRESPFWDGILEQGGLLSMPRGWWHVAYPMDEPSLHLTVTVKNLNEIDLLRWCADQMKTSDTARMELPVVSSDEARQRWLQRTWQDLSSAWGPNLIDRYLADIDRTVRPRPSVHLPRVATQTVSIDQQTPLQLAAPRPLHFDSANGTARFSAAGVDWQTNGDFVSILARFNDGDSHTIAELASERSASLMPLVTALVMKGVLRPTPA